MQKRNVLHSPRLAELKRQRRKIFWAKFLLFLIGLSAALALLAYLSRISAINIGAVEVSGNKIVGNEEIEKVVKEDTSGYYLWLFPKTNLLFYPKEQIKNDLEIKFGRLKDISISTKNNQTLVISVSERNGVYTWCGEELPTETTEQKCFFMDEGGAVFDEAPYFSGDIYFKFYGKVFKSPVANFADLVTFKDNLEKMGVKPIAIYVPPSGDAKVLLSTFNKPIGYPEILFKLDSDFSNLSENLQTALTTKPLQDDFKKKYSALNYIDLRFGNKVYYKFNE